MVLLGQTKLSTVFGLTTDPAGMKVLRDVLVTLVQVQVFALAGGTTKKDTPKNNKATVIKFLLETNFITGI